LLKVKTAFGVIAENVSATDGAAVAVLDATPTEVGAGPTDGPVVFAVEDAAVLTRVAESLEFAERELGGTGLGGGNSSCESAMTTSERKRARKKRLSIQGTGS